MGHLRTNMLLQFRYNSCQHCTGHLTAAIVTLQYDLNKALLWLACRHHIFEVVLDDVWNYLQIEDTTSPEYTVFKRFRSVFNCLPPVTTEQYEVKEVDNVYLKRLHAELIMPLRELSRKYHPRGAYKECLALSLIFLQGSPASPVVLQKSGSVSKARWMAKIIYTLKMVLFWPKIKHEGILHQDKFVDLLKFVNFVVYIYIELWFAGPLPTQAPLLLCSR